MNFVFIVLFLVLCVRLIMEGFRADRAERSRAFAETTAQEAIAIGEDSNKRSREVIAELEQMQKRNLQMQDELLASNQRFVNIMNGKRTQLLLGDPYVWAGGMKAGAEIHFSIQAPKILTL